MDLLTVSFLLSLFMATQATDLSSELDQPPLDESIYIFVVKSDAPINEIKASFGVTGRPRHSFRVIGETTYYYEGTPVKLFDIMMSGMANEWKEAHKNMASAVYMPIAYYPTKLIFFAAFDDNAMQHIFKDEQDVYGGIGVMTSTIKHIVKIKM